MCTVYEKKNICTYNWYSNHLKLLFYSYPNKSSCNGGYNDVAYIILKFNCMWKLLLQSNTKLKSESLNIDLLIRVLKTDFNYIIIRVTNKWTEEVVLLLV